MTDLEKVIKALKLHVEDTDATCKTCPYYEKENTICFTSLLSDILSVLKQQDEIVYCKDCKHRPKEPNLETYESGFDLDFPEGSKCPCRCYGDEWYSWYPDDDWFCADGERRDADGRH